jgi:hypothetical protein
MTIRRYVTGWALATLAGVAAGFFLGLLFVTAGPEKFVAKAENAVTNTKSYEVGWDIEDDTVYKATCEDDRCRWETFNKYRFGVGLVSHLEEDQIRRGTVVQFDTYGEDQIETQGFGELERTDLPSDGDDR